MAAACCQSNGGIKVKETAIRLLPLLEMAGHFRAACFVVPAVTVGSGPGGPLSKLFTSLPSLLQENIRPSAARLGPGKMENTDSGGRGVKCRRLITGGRVRHLTRARRRGEAPY